MKIEKINTEDALDQLKLEDDFEKTSPSYYTVTPSTCSVYPGSDGWEDITYYTGRKLSMYSNREGEGDSWVYVLSNPSMPGMLKIGYTKLTPGKRASQLSRSTGVPTPYNVEWAFHCFNAERLEREVHKILSGCRVSKQKEHFYVNLSEAQEVIKKAGKKYL